MTVQKWMKLIVVMGMIGLLAACGGGSQEIDSTPSEGFIPPTSTIGVAPTLPTIPTSTAPSQQDTDPVEPGMPPDVVGYELLHFQLGEAVYTGYICAIAPVGCACEEAVTQHATFTAVDSQTMLYEFQVGNLRSTWEMNRVAPNEWDYEVKMAGEERQFEGIFFALLSFREDGYLLTQGADLDEGGFVTCPDVFYHRIER